MRKDIHELIQQTSIEICSGPAIVLDTEDVDTGLHPEQGGWGTGGGLFIDEN